MTILLSPRFWLAAAILAALAISHGMAYKTGRATIRAEWDKDKTERTAQALKAEQDARAKEQALQAEKTKVEARYAAEKKRNASAAASLNTELDGLRNALAAVEASANTGTASGANGAGRLERELLGHCAAALVGLAKEADRLETKLIGLQDYVRGVCK